VSCRTATSLGAYALGALDARERERVEQHISVCDGCRDELEALIAVRYYLARLPAEEVDGVDAPRAHRRRVTRRRAAAVAAVLAAVALASVAWSRGGGSAPPAPGSRSAAADTRTGVRATVAATPRIWGTELRVRLSGAAPGQRCRLIARARDGSSDVAATWWTTDGDSPEVTGAAAIPAADLVALDVVTATGRRLVHVPMDKRRGMLPA